MTTIFYSVFNVATFTVISESRIVPRDKEEKREMEKSTFEVLVKEMSNLVHFISVIVSKRTCIHYMTN